jgi:hypothetical protein
MNRLIIIGNGFDLAHGIKTSYEDFISNYLCNAINTFFNKNSYTDSLIEINFKNSMSCFSPTPVPIRQDEVLNYIPIISEKYNFNIKSIVLRNTLNKISEMNWVDLETEYFNSLLATKHGYKDYDQLKAIQLVNNQLDF